MASYGVQTNNLFELLGEENLEDEAPQEVPTPVKPKPLVRVPPKQAEKPGQQPLRLKGLDETQLSMLHTSALSLSDRFIFLTGVCTRVVQPPRSLRPRLTSRLWPELLLMAEALLDPVVGMVAAAEVAVVVVAAGALVIAMLLPGTGTQLLRTAKLLVEKPVVVLVVMDAAVAVAVVVLGETGAIGTQGMDSRKFRSRHCSWFSPMVKS